MKLLEFKIREYRSHNWKTVDLNSDVCVFYSKNNSTGKTTLMRAILYTLGFPIPNTELVKFENYEFVLELSHQDKNYILMRKDQLLKINDTEFDLPVEQSAAHTFLFGIANAEVLYNLLGTIYFDQEKGWTLLNRGTIIGTNRFSIESFFRGLKNDESDESYEIVAKISALDKKIAQYNLMSNIAEYQAAINQADDAVIDYQTFDQELAAKIGEKELLLKEVEAELARVTDIIKSNKSFSDYIECRKIFVRNPIDGNPIPVNRETLLDYQDVTEINQARRSMLIAQRNALKKQLAELTSQQEKQVRLFSLPTLDEELTKRLANIQGISAVEVDSILKKLKKERTDLTNILKNRTKNDNPWIYQAYEIICKYTQELNLSFDYKIDIFTHNLKGKSGAVLHKMVFAYRLAYIKLLSEKIGYALPIFCDSPSGREVEKETIDIMLRILQRDFSEHQLIVASIYKYEDALPNASIIEMDGTLFNQQTMFD
ncbi:MAG: hypothetical protein J6J01_08830 [Oscillospiraceae bacterium]|nr:hypothetical protein [Oscillospiraceae bacterium]